MSSQFSFVSSKPQGPQTPSAPSCSIAPFENDLIGRVVPNETLKQWLAENRGHLELYLQPRGTTHSEKTKTLSPEFYEKADTLRGCYDLVAGIYRPQDVDGPYAEIRYEKVINTDTAKKVKFFAEKEKWAVLDGGSAGRRRYVDVQVTLFAAGSDEQIETNPMIPLAIPNRLENAKVHVVGFEDHYGTLATDSAGNLWIRIGAPLVLAIDELLSIRPKTAEELQADSEDAEDIPRVPKGMVKVDEYAPTQRVIPVFGGNDCANIYMVSAKGSKFLAATAGVKTLVKNLPIIAGRVFDQERNLLKGEKIELKNHSKARGSFTGLNEEGVTSALGFFWYFNVAVQAAQGLANEVGDVFRNIVRPNSEYPNYRIQPIAGHGYYVELGRAGVKPLKGKLYPSKPRGC